MKNNFPKSSLTYLCVLCSFPPRYKNSSQLPTILSHCFSNKFKYDILKHPNVAKTTDGKEKPYIHGGTENAVASISIFDGVPNMPVTEIEEIDGDYELLSSARIKPLTGLNFVK